MGNLPGVYITLGNGNLGRTASTSDGVAGLVLTGKAVEGKLELNKHYLLSGTADLATLGIAPEDNRLIDKEVRAFYAHAGEGAELHLLVVAEATTLTAMCDPGDGSPVGKLLDAAGGRIRLLGVNKILPEEYDLVTDQGIDADVVAALEKIQQNAEAARKAIRPFRALLPAVAWTIATTGYFTDGSLYTDRSGMAEILNDAGYIFYMKYPTRNGCYLNGDPMAAPVTDDYSQLYLGRVVDKAVTIIYDTYITEVLDNISINDDGTLDQNQCIYLQNQIIDAVTSQMDGQISSFDAYIDPAQNILATGNLQVSTSIVPMGVINRINVDLAFSNPAKTSD